MENFEQLPLRDIHLPDPVSWWPPAAGWWALLVLMILTVFGVWWWRRKSAGWRRRRKLMRLAAAELTRIEKTYRVAEDPRAALEELSVLIRRTAMSVFGRERVASLSGVEWLDWLQQSDSGNHFDEKALQQLTQGPYQKTVAADMSPLLDAARRWLSALPRRASDIPIIQDPWRAGHDSF